jgi:hypothetical protein
MTGGCENMNLDLAPIILFIYNRPGHTRRTLEALTKNIGADRSALYVFADGPKENASPADLNLINEARAVIREQSWCREVFLITREKNMDLEDNVIDGISHVINKHGKAIILEDDILTSPHFLQYCNDGLKVYENAKQVFSINGFMFPIDFQTEKETFLCPVATSSWGWATWADRWRLFETQPTYTNEINSDTLLKGRFDVGGQNKTVVLYYMNTWDIRWYYTAFIRNGLGLFPTKSLTLNMGFDGSGTHGGNENLQQEIFTSPITVNYTDSINLKHYAKLLNYVKIEPLTLKQQIKNKIKRMLRIK